MKKEHCVPGCGTENGSCENCLYYGGRSHGAVRCLAGEKSLRAPAGPKIRHRKDKKKNGDQNQP